MAYQRQYWKDYDESKTETQNIEAGSVVTAERLNVLENGVVLNYQEVTSQLAQTETEIKAAVEKKADQDFVDAQLSSLISGAPKATFATTSALQNAYPNGESGVFLVLENGHWYTWDIPSSTWEDRGVYQEKGISDYDKNFIGNGQFFSLENSPLDLGYKRFLVIPFEMGALNPSNGNNINTESSIRTPSGNKVKFFYDKVTLFLKSSLYRYRYIEFDENDSYLNTSLWFTDTKKEITLNSKNSYRFEVSRLDSSKISINDAYLNFKVSYQVEKTDNFASLGEKISKTNEKTKGRALQYDSIPFRYGFNKELLYAFEKGSISSSNGNDIDTSVDSVRTPKNKMIQFTDNLTVINLNKTLLRIKFLKYSSAGALLDAGLFTNTDKTTINIDKNSLYRIQISSTNGQNIGLDQVDNIHIFYKDDKFAEIPSYWQSYLNERIKYIRTLMTKGKDITSFIVTTDTHYTPDNVNDINPKVAKYLADKLNIDTMIHLGDFSAENQTKDVAVEYLEHVNAEYKKVTDNYLAIRGNHDDNNEGNKERTFDKVISQKESYSWVFNRMENVHFGETGTYYYFDKPFEKVRFIGLDCVDFPYEVGADGYIKGKALAWGYNQLKWLSDTALKVPAGYQIIILNHSGITDTVVTKNVGVENSKQSKPLNVEDLIDILNAFKNKTNFSKEISITNSVFPEYYSGSLSVDFSQYNGEIVGIFSGHEHIDDIQPIELSGYKNIFTLNNSVNFPKSIPSSAYQPERTMFTTSEEVYDVVLIDRESRTTKLIRIGAGLSSERSFSY